MTTLFYLFALFFLMYEVFWLLDLSNKIKKRREEYKVMQENKDKKGWDNYTDEYKKQMKYALFVKMPLFVWMFVGLLSAQWLVFACFLVLQLAIFSWLIRLTINTWFAFPVNLVNTMIGITFGTYILLNHYHFHIDTYNILLNLIIKMIR